MEFETLNDMRQIGGTLYWEGAEHQNGGWSATHDDGKLISAYFWSNTQKRCLTLVEPRGLPTPEHQCAATHPDFPDMRCERHKHPDTHWPNHVIEHQNGLNKWKSRR